ncbi:hypothetical protein [Thiothrix unzii]|jgi:hypothetical protein|uniref:hypothetical protein n=1 Tax=Thiothrix unzii TaxID=111769 RepID=UPI002A363715|nr:hypothetical protein [Thiothrix unzii]MDX9988534.1 hypothetical protein [Thiothrix unzii]
MLAVNPLRERLVEEISQIPDTKLAEVLDFIYYFRLGLQASQLLNNHQPTQAAQPDDLLDELKRCIRQPNPAPIGDFCLDLRNYRFDREEANAR